MRTLRYAVPVLFFLFLSLDTTAKNYYVAPNGDDAADGTPERPLATITAAVQRAGAGDHVIVRGGIYRQSVNIFEKAGTPAEPIYVSEHPGETAVIDGTGITANGLVIIDRSAHVRFENFEVRNSSGAGIMIRDSSYIKVRGNEVHECAGGGIQASSSAAQPAGTTHDIVIDGNEVYRCVLENRERVATSGWQQAIAALRAARVEITENRVHENYGEGIDYILSDDGLIAHNKVWDNYSANIYLDNAQSTRVDSNFIYASGAEAFHRNGQPADGIVAANEAYPEQNPLDGLTITNNIVVRTNTGFNYFESQYGRGLHNSTIANNVFYSTVGPGVKIENGTGGVNVHDTTTFAGNIVYQKYGRPFASVPAAGITFRGNTWFGGGDPATIAAGEGDSTTDPMLVNPGGLSAADYKRKAPAAEKPKAVRAKKRGSGRR